MTRRDPRPLRTTALLYAGILIGFSFIATPAKFLAPGVTMADLLLVGRATFDVFAWVETALALGVLTLAFTSRTRRATAVLVCAIIAAQYLVLRPILDARVSAIVGGADPTPSGLHHVYGVLELAKLGLLIRAAWPARLGTETRDGASAGTLTPAAQR